MSLLDDVSIVVTPNGYKAGELYAVVPVPTEGAEEGANMDFSSGTSPWALNSNWSLGGVGAIADGTSNGTIWQNAVVEDNKQYIVTYTLTDFLQGTLKISLSGNDGVSRDIAGTYTEILTSGTSPTTRLTFEGGGNFKVTLSNVIVKEYTSADMDVTRSTAATRVDENGLVNYAEVVSDTELVTNGDFANGTTDWSANANATLSIDTGRLKIAISGAGSGYAHQTFTIESGKQYKCTGTIDFGTASQMRFYVSNTGQFFDITQSGDFDFTFTSTGTSTQIRLYTYGDGNYGFWDNISVKEVTRDNVPRIDYTGGGCPHILAEPQRTNLLTYSEDFSQGVWVKTDANIVSNFGISPSGNLDADKITFDTTNVQARAQVNLSGLTSGNEYNQSYYLKSLGSDVTLRIGTSGAVAGEFVDVIATSEWQRFDITTTASGTTEYPRFQNINGIINTEILVWGAQMEEGSYATSYIPTSGSTVTRNQDIFTRDGIGSLINSTEGVLFLESSVLSNDGTYKSFSLSDGTTSNTIRFYTTPTLNQLAIRVTVSGSHEFNVVFTLTDLTVLNKMALKYKSNDFAFWVNGVEVKTSTSGNTYTANTLNSLQFDRGDGVDTFFGKVKQLQVYNTALTDTQLAALTS